MARKRGGLAGLYDRNKGAIKALAPAALSFIPGVGIPLAAAAGAALGADKEGRRYGDLGGALKGGLSGAAIGAGTQGARALLTGGGPMSGMVPKIGGRLPAANMSVGVTPGTGGIQSAVTSAIGGGQASGMGGTVGGLLKGIRENKDLIGGAVKGIQTMLPNPANDARLMEAETGRMEFEERKRRDMLQDQQDQERRRRIAELLTPIMQQNYPQYFGNR